MIRGILEIYVCKQIIIRQVLVWQCTCVKMHWCKVLRPSTDDLSLTLSKSARVLRDSVYTDIDNCNASDMIVNAQNIQQKRNTLKHGYSFIDSYIDVHKTNKQTNSDILTLTLQFSTSQYAQSLKTKADLDNVIERPPVEGRSALHQRIFTHVHYRIKTCLILIS